jgi:hypothetical protein
MPEPFRRQLLHSHRRHRVIRFETPGGRIHDGHAGEDAVRRPRKPTQHAIGSGGVVGLA